MDKFILITAIAGTTLIFGALGYGIVSLLMLWGIV